MGAKTPILLIASAEQGGGRYRPEFGELVHDRTLEGVTGAPRIAVRTSGWLGDQSVDHASLDEIACRQS